MREAGVDISRQRSKHVDELKHLHFDYVVTVCDSAREACPVFPGKAKVVHVGFEAPPALAAGSRTEEEAMAHYPRVSDEIREFIETLPEARGAWELSIKPKARGRSAGGRRQEDARKMRARENQGNVAREERGKYDD